ncbi:MAG: RDD family protein [Betaproteobacteria bacterium]
MPADATPATTTRPPNLLHRIAAMVYEAVLLFGVVFGVSFALLAATGWTYPLPPGRRAVLQAVLFLAIGGYFVYCWSRSGQTLAMRSWRLRLIERDGGPVSVRRAIMRYLLAWHLFAPGLLFIALVQTHAALDSAVFVLGFAGMLALAYTDARRQLLHDRVLGTQVVVTAPEAARGRETAAGRR